MNRPILATVKLDHLRHNLDIARRHAGAAKLWAVIKANAYGHGMGQVAQALAAADGFAVLSLDAAEQLRASGIARPILLLEGVFRAEELPRCAELGLTVVVHAGHQLDWLASARLSRPLDIYLKLNSGMNRLGFAPAQMAGACASLRSLASVASITLMTHFATADDAAGITAQLDALEPVSQQLGLPVCAANSAALLRHSGAVGGEWVRPGIMLYGSSPFADQSAAELGLKPVMTLTTELISVQTLQAGDVVGYGAAFMAPGPMRIGTAACGYADGYPRHAPTGTPLLVDGQASRLIGRVSMDMLAVDLTDIPSARPGSSVTLWGEGLSVDVVASAAQTISYELLCAVAPRVPLRYL